MCHQYSEATPVSKPVRRPETGLAELVATQNSWGEECDQQTLQKRGGRGQGDAGLLMQGSSPRFVQRASPSPPSFVSYKERQQKLEPRRRSFSAALFPSLEDLLEEEEVRHRAATWGRAFLPAPSKHWKSNGMERTMKPHFTGAFIFYN